MTFLPGYRKVTVPEGTTLLDAARAAGLSMNVVCGGQGKCGKCLVFIKEGTVTFDREKYRRFFSNDEIARGACLACQATVVGDIQVNVPAESLIQEQKILVEVPGLEGIPFNPAVRKYEVRLEPPSLDDTTDLTRVLEGIEKQGGPPPPVATHRSTSSVTPAGARRSGGT